MVVYHGVEFCLFVDFALAPLVLSFHQGRASTYAYKIVTSRVDSVDYQRGYLDILNGRMEFGISDTECRTFPQSRIRREVQWMVDSVSSHDPYFDVPDTAWGGSSAACT